MKSSLILLIPCFIIAIFPGCGNVENNPCGNGVCEPGYEETCLTCSIDCGCTQGETCQNGVCITSGLCGNGSCDMGEDTQSCPQDCPCSSGYDCGPVELCDLGNCETATGRVYKVTILDADLNYTQNSADGDSSNPDPFVTVYFPDINSPIGRTSTVQDTLTPTWNEYLEVTVLASGQSIWFCMNDEDLLSDDVLYFEGNYSCRGYNNIIDFIKTGEVIIEGTADVNWLNVKIDLK